MAIAVLLVRMPSPVAKTAHSAPNPTPAARPRPLRGGPWRHGNMRQHAGDVPLVAAATIPTATNAAPTAPLTAIFAARIRLRRGSNRMVVRMVLCWNSPAFDHNAQGDDQEPQHLHWCVRQ